jgi:hypothetical protein
MTVLHRIGSRWLAVSVLIGSCESTTGPSTLPAPPSLSIAPVAEYIPVGSAITLTASVASGSSAPHPVAASWSSDANDVIAVDASGHVQAVALGKATVQARYEELSATLPLRGVPRYPGTWRGTYKVTACRQTGGQGPSYCRFAVQAVFPLSVVLTSAAGPLSGRLEFYGTGGSLIEVGSIEATISDAYDLMLDGTTASVDAEQPGTTSLSDWQSTLVSSDGMRGHFVKNRHFRNSFGWQDSREECEIIDLRREAP